MNKINHNKLLEYNTLSGPTTDGTNNARGCEDLLSQSPLQ
jgi:hypothetical protein